MKKLFLAVFIISSFYSFSQKVDGARVMVDSIVVDSLDKPQQEINELIANWFALRFNNSSKVITSNTPSLIQGRYINSFVFGGTSVVDFHHDISIDIKENKVRIQLWIGDYSAQYFYKKDGNIRSMYSKGLNKLTQDGKETVQSLVDYLRNSEAKSSDW